MLPVALPIEVDAEPVPVRHVTARQMFWPMSMTRLCSRHQHRTVPTGARFEDGPIGPFIGTVRMTTDPVFAGLGLPELAFHVFERDPQ